MPSEYATDGDIGFIGLNTRDNPSSLPVGILNFSRNMRLDRGTARTRRGVRKYSLPETLGPGRTVVGSGVYIDSSGQEIIMTLVSFSATSQTFLYQFNPATNSHATPVNLYNTVTSSNIYIPTSDGVSMTHAMGKVFITRGHSLRPIWWDMLNTFHVLPTGGSGSEFPNCTHLMFYMNRLVALGKYPGTTAGDEKRTVCVSHFLDWTKWSSADAYLIDQGGNDETVALVPWTMNEFVVMMRNSSFYLKVGLNKHVSGDPLPDDAALYTLANDVGCIAKRTAIQVAEGIMFLSDNGVYFLRPNPSGNDGVKLLTLGDPISAPVDDVIGRINKDAASKATAAYWNNRYYLAVPLDNSAQNNAVLVFNFILKQWESVDTYPAGVDFMDFLVAKKDRKRRLFGTDSLEGILLLEEGTSDETGNPVGVPTLSLQSAEGAFPGEYGFILDQQFVAGANFYPDTNPLYVGPPLDENLTVGALLNEAGYISQVIVGEILTRRYTYQDPRDKRFSSIEADIDCAPGGAIETTVETVNPDTITLIDRFTSPVHEDTTRRNPVRKIAHGLQVRYKTLNQNPAIRSSYVRAIPLGKTNQNST